MRPRLGDGAVSGPAGDAEGSAAGVAAGSAGAVVFGVDVVAEPESAGVVDGAQAQTGGQAAGADRPGEGAGPPELVIEPDRVAAWLLASGAVTVKFDVPAAVGVPVITRAVLRLSPGREPSVDIQVHRPKGLKIWLQGELGLVERCRVFVAHLASSRQSARCLALDAAAVKTVRVLAAGGIPSLLLKGPAVARRLYPESPGERAYCDVDLLVAPADFAVAEAALADSGYRSAIEGIRPDEWCWHERGWHAPGQVPLSVDLHRSFAGVNDPDAFWTALWSTAEELRLAGGSVSVPDEAAAALLLALHAAAPGPSTKPGRELQVALDLLPEEHWRAAAELARITKSESAYAVGLRLVPAGAELALRLGLPTAADRMEWLSANAGSRVAYSLAKLTSQPGGWRRLTYFGRRLAPSRGWMRYDSALARRGWAGLLLAYVARAALLAWTTPRAIFELRAATAAARGPVSPAEADQKS